MRHSKSCIALAALLVTALSMPAFARSGGGGHSSGRGAQGSAGGHSHSRPRGFAPYRHYSGRPRIGLFLGAPVFAFPYFYPAPGVLAPMPPIEYIEMPPGGSLYFCPEANGYYPDVQECPSGWEQAQPTAPWQPPAPTWNPPAGDWDPSSARY